MKLLLSLLALVLPIAGLAQSQEGGRYQLLSAKVLKCRGETYGDCVTQDGLFRIDTKTGETWEYFHLPPSLGSDAYWAIIMSDKEFLTKARSVQGTKKP